MDRRADKPDDLTWVHKTVPKLKEQKLCDEKPYDQQTFFLYGKYMKQGTVHRYSL